MKCFVKIEVKGKDGKGVKTIQRFRFGTEREGGEVSVSKVGENTILRFDLVEVTIDNETARTLLDLLMCLEAEC